MPGILRGCWLAAIAALIWNPAALAVDATVAASVAPPATAAPVPATGAEGDAAPLNRAVYTLRQLGIDYRMDMAGPQTTLGIPFGIRLDQVPMSARLMLSYHLPDRLPAGQALLSVRLNGIPAGRLTLHASDAGHQGQWVLPLPAEGLTDFNQIELDLSAAGKDQCRPHAQPEPWLQIDDSSRLEVVSRPLIIANDLARWPLPYFDRRDIGPLRVTMVFAPHPEKAVLRSAGLLASWLGSLAGYRGTDFAVSEGVAPAGRNAIALVTPEHPLEGVQLPAITGPQVEMRDLDAYGHKLLLVMGRNDAELRTAVLGLIRQRDLGGAAQRFTTVAEPEPRHPYDAPAWLGSQGPSTLASIGQDGTFSVTGPSPDGIRVDLAMPPDLYAPQAATVPLKLRYRATAAPPHGGWSLAVSVGDSRVAHWWLAEATDPTSMFARWRPLVDDDQMIMKRETVDIPLARLGSRSQLRFQFRFMRRQGCITAASREAGATIDPTSTIDISALGHFIAMPDLAAFVNSGFPFSRLADLSATAIVLPDVISPALEAQLLNLLGLIGAHTGYPAYRVSLTDADHVAAFAADDLLVLGTSQTQPLFRRWASALPTQSEPAGWLDRLRRWAILHLPEPVRHSRRPDLPSSVDTVFDLHQFDAVMMGFRSPLAHDRSVVAIESLDTGTADRLFEALRDPRALTRFQGSIVTVRDRRVQSYQGLQTYYVGHLGLWGKGQWLLSNAPWLVVLLGLLSAALAAALARAILRKRADYRLNEEYRDD